MIKCLSTKDEMLINLPRMNRIWKWRLQQVDLCPKRRMTRRYREYLNLRHDTRERLDCRKIRKLRFKS